MPKISMRDGHLTYVREIGSGPTIILLHGFGMQSQHWLPFALTLSKSYRVLMPDFRGFGKSHYTPYNQECVISNFREDLEDIVSAYTLKEYKMAGISMGALVGLDFLTHTYRPEVKHYLHIDQAPRCENTPEWQWGLFGEENAERFERAKSLVARLRPYYQDRTALIGEIPGPLKKELWTELGEFFASAMSKPFHKRLARLLCTKETALTRLMPMDNWPAYIECLNAYMEQDYDVVPKLSRLETPVSLLVGLKSDMYPCGGQLRIADHIKDCRVIPFENSGHAPMIDEPFKFIRELRKFAAY